MTTTAWVVHRIAGRLRLRLPERKGDALFFAGLAESVRALPGVIEARPSPLAASLVVEHEVVPREQLDAALTSLGLGLIEGEPAAEPPLQALAGSFAEVERELRSVTGNATDLRTLGFLALAAAGLVQIVRGQPLSAASSLLWHAAELLRDMPRTTQALGRVEPPATPDE